MMNNTPPATRALVLICALIYLLSLVSTAIFGRDYLTELGGLSPVIVPTTQPDVLMLSPYFKFWQPITYMFLHGGIWHILFNMYALWMFGRQVENVWGAKRFVTFFLVCGVGAAITQEVVQFVELYYWNIPPGYTVGASGAIYGILLAFALMWPNQQLFIFPLPIPIRVKYAVFGFIALEMYLALAQHQGDMVAHFAHLGGMLFGFLLIRYWRWAYTQRQKKNRERYGW